MSIRSLVLPALASLALASACGGSGKKDTTTAGTGDSIGDGSSDKGQESADEKFARQSEDTVNKMCQRLVDCSIQDAAENMDPAEFEKMKTDGTIPAAINECTEQYVAANFSPRQIIGIRECLGQPTECSVFNECITGAVNAPASE